MAAFEIETFTLGGFIGTLVGIYLGHSLAIRRGKSLVKHNAALELKKALHPTILKLKNGDSPTIIVSAYFDKHLAAVMDYSGHLSGSELESYREAINAYSHWYKTMCHRAREEVLYGDNDPEYLAEKAKDAAQLISKILKHANT